MPCFSDITSFCFFLSFAFIAKELAQLWENLKREVKLELEEFRESWDHDFRKGIRDVSNRINFTSKAYDEIKQQLGTIPNENKELKYANTGLGATCKAIINQANTHCHTGIPIVIERNDD